MYSIDTALRQIMLCSTVLNACITKRRCMPGSIYYRAIVEKKRCWFFTAIVRSFEHLMFDRTCDVPTNTFEFFVPESSEKIFLELMDFFSNEGIVHGLHKSAVPFERSWTLSEDRPASSGQ